MATYPTPFVAEMAEKINRLSIPRNMSYRPVLIYAGMISPALADSEYFTAKIDFGEFLR